jgi:hypothetical protein
MAEEMNHASRNEEVYNTSRNAVLEMHISLRALSDAKTAEAWAREISTELVRNTSLDKN